MKIWLLDNEKWLMKTWNFSNFKWWIFDWCNLCYHSFNFWNDRFEIFEILENKQNNHGIIKCFN